MQLDGGRVIANAASVVTRPHNLNSEYLKYLTNKSIGVANILLHAMNLVGSGPLHFTQVPCPVPFQAPHPDLFHYSFDVLCSYIILCKRAQLPDLPHYFGGSMA